jgi:hypothetical protein
MLVEAVVVLEQTQVMAVLAVVVLVVEEELSQ